MAAQPPSIDAILSGEHTAVRALLETGPEAAGPLVQRILEGAPPAPAFAATAWALRPAIKPMIKKLRGALRRVQASDRWEAENALVAWVCDSMVAAFPPLHDAVIEARIHDLTHRAREDGGFKDARALEVELRQERPSDPRLGSIALLVAKGAFVVRDALTARRAASRAVQAFERQGDSAGMGSARRTLAGAMLVERDWQGAFSMLDQVLAGPGSLSSLEGVTVPTPASDRQDAAIDEARQVVLFASRFDPEWVRALGVLAEAFADDAAGTELLRRFERALADLRSLPAFEVVVRQLRERSCQRSALIAATAAVRAQPDDSLMRSVLANLSRELGEHEAAYEHFRIAAELLDAQKSPDAAFAWISTGDAAATLGRIAEADVAFENARSRATTDSDRWALELHLARALRQRDPASAQEKAFALFSVLARQPQTLVESELGFATIELLLELLVAEKDPRAIEVQTAVVEAKRTLWGECPAVWLERHNLGTVYAQLGDPAHARSLIEDALMRLQEAFGAEHLHVELCRSSLAKLGSTLT